MEANVFNVYRLGLPQYLRERLIEKLKEIEASLPKE